MNLDVNDAIRILCYTYFFAGLGTGAAAAALIWMFSHKPDRDDGPP
jgi:hypothetical protein